MLPCWKLTILTIGIKHEIIEKFENGQSETALAKKYGIGKAPIITDIKKQEHVILNCL